ncbi:unnamed protein product [Caenorhabditis sp. 36 PRJEB53466]|nr:unnamed protein product [Caenorhabditis sp. 36 PRJEB53466]
MRELSLLLFLSVSVNLALANDHDHSLKHVQKRHDIPLEFIMNSHEHSDIRRSVRLEKDISVQRMASDKFVVRRDEPGSKAFDSTEVTGDSEPVPDKFDQPSYDFMLPEGRAEKSTILAVVDFITKKHNAPPTFAVNFDENQWFDVGSVEKTTADNADVYKATVILREGADVAILKTDGGVYKFVVEAQQGEAVLASTNIAVDVLSLAPTTKRSRVVTVPSEPTILETEAGVTVALTTSEASTTPESSESSSEEAPTTLELPTSEDPTSPEDLLTLGAVTPSEEPLTSFEDVDSSGDTSEDLHGSAEVPESSGEPEDLKTPTSSELLTSEDPESPIEGPVTILPLKASQEGKMEALDAHLEIIGAPEGVISIARASRPGDVIRNLQIVLQTSKTNRSELAELSVEPAGALQIRPSLVLPGEPASLFLGSLELLKRLQTVEIIAKYSDSTVTIRQPLRLRIAQDSEESAGSEMSSLREIELTVVESAESGRTVGSVDGDMKILGGNEDRFSLVGNDIIVSCGHFDTDKCLQHDDRKTFTLMLMPRNGTLAPLQVTIRVQQHANVRTSDNVIRISDNRIISPFAVITERTSKSITLTGDGAKFLGFVKAADGLYQLIVVNSAASGRYTLQIGVEDPEDTPTRSVDVFVENSLAHAHFRKSKYEMRVDARHVTKDLKLTQVELEGVPIDAAKIMILDANPGWVTVEDYGGHVKVGKYDGPVLNGKYAIRIGAVDRKTWTILTETVLELSVENGEEKAEEEKKKKKKKKTESRVIEETFDRENEEMFGIEVEEENLKLDPNSLFGIDEKGRRVQVEPTSITMSKSHLNINKDSLKSLRILGFSLKSQEPDLKVSVVVRLISSPQYLETMRKNAARPVYPEPWSRAQNVIHVEMNEELAQGQVVGVFPATSPLDSGVTEPSKLSGDMREAFDFDETSGELKIRQRIDFESLSDAQKTFDLTLTSGEPGFESQAVLRVTVVDVDDNSPIIADVGIVSVPENLAAGSKIVELNVRDPDGSASYRVNLSGNGAENYRANITANGTLSIYVSDDARIDRELEDAHALLVQVSDVSGNSDRILVPIVILDVNDNAPEFKKKVYDVEVVEDWPRGIILGRILAKDADLGTASDVRYRIEGDDDDDGVFVAVNSTSGVLTVAAELWGLASHVPYKYRLIAEDSGAPPLNSTTMLSVRVRAKEELITDTFVAFLEPKSGAQVVVKENVPLDSKILTAKAELRGIPSQTRATLLYSLKDLLNDEKEPSFAIDRKSDALDVSRTYNIRSKLTYRDVVKKKA